MNREKELEELKLKPDNRFCSCGLEGFKQFRTCKNSSCQEDIKHQENVNSLVERGWLPVSRWRHT